MDKIEMAIKIATKAHKGQKDKSGKIYILHPLAVAKSFDSNDEKIVAILHDVVEDTDYTLKYLSDFFSDKIINAIDAITRREGEKYFNYIKRVKLNSLATKVKIADIEHNKSPDRKFKDSEGLMKRYDKALDILKGS